jgi:hypothetical protein
VLLAVVNVEAFGWRLPMHLFPWTAVVRPGDPALFASLPLEARRNYGGTAPGGVPQEAEDDGDPARFASIALELRRIDALVLDDPHVRAVFETPGWAGRWVAP